MKKTSAVLLILLTFVLVGGGLVYLNSSKQVSVNSTTQESILPIANFKTYKSSALDFTVKLPREYQVEESITIVDFKFEGKFIDLGRSDGSGFSVLERYLSDLDEKNKCDLQSYQLSSVLIFKSY